MALISNGTELVGDGRMQRRRRALKRRYQELRRIAEYDELTGIYNKSKFLRASEALLSSWPEARFVLVRMRLNRFRLVKDYLGAQESDALLCYLSDMLCAYAEKHPPSVYGRIEGEVFALCCPFVSREAILADITALQAHVRRYNLAFDLVASFGLYCIEDADMPAADMLDRAALAAATVGESDTVTVAFYSDDMGQRIESERALVNDMQHALETGQFRILIQPKFDLRTGQASGGEALVRWHHPEQGVISPGAFVPLFERNGLIMKLDYVVWELACQKLREWLDNGHNPYPLSVNVSRVNLYNPYIVERITALVEQYRLPPQLLQLELTEDAYVDNPTAMRQAVATLRRRGFQIALDDFGDGSSSLNILREIALDALKINITSCSNADLPEHGGNVIASVVRMAKWLELPVIAKGVETFEQVEFLKGIGCDFAQGFFYSYPLDPDNYIALKAAQPTSPEILHSEFDINTLWTDNSQMEMLFSGAPQAAGLYEYDDVKRTLDCLRVNRMFSEMFGYDDTAIDNNPMQNAVVESKLTLMEAANAAVERRGAAECEYLRRSADGSNRWINLKFKYISSIGRRHILLGSFFDISAYKEIELELFKFRSAMVDIGKTTKRMLVVDDQKINRDILRKIFASEFTVIEAASGGEALKLLEKQDEDVDVILLDMLMPGMDGEAFLKIKQADARLEQIPVIIVTSEDSAEQQINMLAIGAYDYVVKPLIPEVIRRRVYNVMESGKRLHAMLREYQQVASRAKEDPLTRVYNRAAAEERITEILQNDGARLHAMVMIDIDDYKNVNDTYGHNCGDLVLMEFGNKLAHFFRAGDIVARMGGDEFCVLMVGMPSAKVALNKCLGLCSSIRGHAIGEPMLRISCSAGVAMSEPGISFETLYRRSDEALYQAKHRNKGSVVLYEAEEGKEE